uniref:Ectonucleotide pyrophosphatase/phosphodiesterase 7 n=1 Tax=Laticauda laticaudata TaxID=8630 RepID=A0A8C5RII1_LATLA
FFLPFSLFSILPFLSLSSLPSLLPFFSFLSLLSFLSFYLPSFPPSFPFLPCFPFRSFLLPSFLPFSFSFFPFLLSIPWGNANYSGQSVMRTLAESFTHPDSNETEWRENIDIVMNWFAKEDFDFVTLYYGEPDHTGHFIGPETEARKKIIRQIDRTLGYLLNAIEKHGLKDTLNVIITSDHGMTTVKKKPEIQEILLKNTIQFKDLVKFDIVDYGGFGMILPKQGKEEEIYQKLKKAHPHLHVYKKEEFPERFHYAKHKRVLPILLYGDPGYRIIIYVNKGDHGFDNEDMDMKTIFRAFGPDFKKGYLAEPFDSIHIYPLMCKLLGIQPELNNGSLALTEDMLKSSASGKCIVPLLGFGTISLLFLLIFNSSRMQQMGVYASVCSCKHFSFMSRTGHLCGSR